MARGDGCGSSDKQAHPRGAEHYLAWLNGTKMVDVRVVSCDPSACLHPDKVQIGMTESRTDYDVNVKYFCPDCRCTFSDYDPAPHPAALTVHREPTVYV